MKRFVKRMLLVMGIMGSINSANAGKEPTQILSINPVGAIFGMIEGEYEDAYKKTSSLVIDGFFWNEKADDWKWLAIGAGGGYRKYFTSQAIFKGGFYGFGVNFLSISAKYIEEEGSSFFIIPKGEIGYRWLLGEKKSFSISVGAGVGLYIGKLEIRDESIPFSGISIGIPVNLGYAW